MNKSRPFKMTTACERCSQAGDTASSCSTWWTIRAILPRTHTGTVKLVLLFDRDAVVWTCCRQSRTALLASDRAHREHPAAAPNVVLPLFFTTKDLCA